MKKKMTAQTMQAIEFRRADPEALALFDETTKRCTMNCGPHAQDMRTSKERQFLCEDCEVDPVAQNDNQCKFCGGTGQCPDCFGRTSLHFIEIHCSTCQDTCECPVCQAW